MEDPEQYIIDAVTRLRKQKKLILAQIIKA